MKEILLPWQSNISHSSELREVRLDCVLVCIGRKVLNVECAGLLHLGIFGHEGSTATDLTLGRLTRLGLSLADLQEIRRSLETNRSNNKGVWTTNNSCHLCECLPQVVQVHPAKVLRHHGRQLVELGEDV